MKMSRAERKAFNLGKKVGYSEGYAKGLYDGNPINKILDVTRQLIEKLTQPEVLKMLKEARDAEEGEQND